MREGLDVLHERRRATNAALEGPRWGEGRPGGASVEETDERGLLAADEARRDNDDLQVEALVETASASLVERVARPVSTSSRALPSIATNAWRAPIAAAASATPSRTRCGTRRSSVLSLKLTGSPSAAVRDDDRPAPSRRRRQRACVRPESLRRRGRAGRSHRRHRTDRPGKAAVRARRGDRRARAVSRPGAAPRAGAADRPRASAAMWPSSSCDADRAGQRPARRIEPEHDGQVESVAGRRRSQTPRAASLRARRPGPSSARGA